MGIQDKLIGWKVHPWQHMVEGFNRLVGHKLVVMNQYVLVLRNHHLEVAYKVLVEIVLEVALDCKLGLSAMAYQPFSHYYAED